MKKEVKIKYNPQQLQAFEETLKALEIWSYNANMSDWYKKNLSESGPAFCFEYPLNISDKQEKVNVWFFGESGRQSLHITNITPVIRNEVITEYIRTNYWEIQEDLFNKLKNYFPNETFLEVSKEWKETEAFNKLKLFSQLANKATGTNHQLDFERWYAFVNSAYENKIEIPSDELFEALLDLGWEEELANRLVDKFEDFIRLFQLSSTKSVA